LEILFKPSLGERLGYLDVNPGADERASYAFVDNPRFNTLLLENIPVQEVVCTRGAFSFVRQNRFNFVLRNRIQAKRRPRSVQHAVLANINEPRKCKLLHMPAVYLAPESDVHDHGRKLAVEFRLAPIGIDTLPEVTQ